MSSYLHSTTSLSVIRKWAEERAARPARVKGSAAKGTRLLRLIFPEFHSEELLEEIPWDVWYDLFRKSHLKFLYQDHTKDSRANNFFKLIDRG